jgi:hypothetical protein
LILEHSRKTAPTAMQPAASSRIDAGRAVPGRAEQDIWPFDTPASGGAP